MTAITRRRFLQSASTAAAFVSGSLEITMLRAAPFGLPIGLQLYSVRKLLPSDYEGTLKQIAALGYAEVEAAGFFNRSAEQVRQALGAAGLRMPSAHYSHDELSSGIEAIIAFNKALGTRFIVCSFPGIKDPARLKGHSFSTLVQSFTLDDWRWNADEFNRMGANVNAAGMRFAYHNHTMEFGAQDGVVPFDELLRLTDPSLVSIELDCGWVWVGGGDPVKILKRHADRISMLHVKQFKKTAAAASITAPPPAAEMGMGVPDYRLIFAAARKANIKHCFVEQEEFDMPPMEALKIDLKYMKRFKT